MSYRIRAAAPADAASLLAIYAPYVTDTCVSFEPEVPTVEEFERRIQATLDRAAYLVAEDSDSGAVAGYAYNGSFRSRPAYDWAFRDFNLSSPWASGARARLGAARCPRRAHATSGHSHERGLHHVHKYRVDRFSWAARLSRVRRAYRLRVQAGTMAFRHLDGKAAAAARRHARAPAWLERRGD